MKDAKYRISRNATAKLCIALLSIAAAVRGFGSQDLTIDQIIAKNDAAVGGSDSIRQVQALRLTSSTVLGDDPVRVPITITVKRPNLARTDMVSQGKTITSGFDGVTAWVINPNTGTAEPLPSDQFASRSLTSFPIDVMLGSLRGMVAEGQLQLLGSEAVRGSNAYHIRADRKDGVTFDYFIDQKTFLIVKIATQFSQNTGKQDVESYPTDYRTVNGLMLSYSLDLQIAGHSTFQMQVQSIEINPVIDDNIFKANSVDKPTPK